MFAPALQTGGEPQQAGFVVTGGRLHAHQFGFAFGQRAGLVDHQGIDLAQHLDRFGVLEQDAAGGAFAHRDHDRHGRRQAQRAGARDDQHRHRIDQRVRQARLRSGQRPHREGDRGCAHHDGHKVAGHYVGELLNRRAAALRLGNHAHDLRQQRLRADPLRSHDQRAGAVHGSAGEPRARLLFDRNRLARDHGFVHRTGAFEHHAIHRNLLAGTDAKPVADLHLF